VPLLFSSPDSSKKPDIGIDIIEHTWCRREAAGLAARFTGDIDAPETRRALTTHVWKPPFPDQPTEVVHGIARLRGRASERQHFIVAVTMKLFDIVKEFVDQDRPIDERVQAAEFVPASFPTSKELGVLSFGFPPVFSLRRPPRRSHARCRRHAFESRKSARWRLLHATRFVMLAIRAAGLRHQHASNRAWSRGPPGPEPGEPPTRLDVQRIEFGD